MNAPPDAQLRLLEVQAADSELDRLAHRRAALPELAELERIDARLTELTDLIIRARTEDGDLARQQGKLEGDVDQVRSRAARDRQRLDTGSVGSPRELENLQSEIASLARRQGDLEEQALEIMEVREDVQRRLAALVDEQHRLQADREGGEQRRDAAYAELDAAAGERHTQRAALAGELPADLLVLYEKIRADRGGVGAAALRRGRCEGCHLTLSGQDVAGMRAAPPEAVVRCEECRRILVRTAESGL